VDPAVNGITRPGTWESHISVRDFPAGTIRPVFRKVWVRVTTGMVVYLS
jgi:hypothetical protein